MCVQFFDSEWRRPSSNYIFKGDVSDIMKILVISCSNISGQMFPLLFTIQNVVETISNYKVLNQKGSMNIKIFELGETTWLYRPVS